MAKLTKPKRRRWPLILAFILTIIALGALAAAWYLVYYRPV